MKIWSIKNDWIGGKHKITPRHKESKWYSQSPWNSSDKSLVTNWHVMRSSINVQRSTSSVILQGLSLRKPSGHIVIGDDDRVCRKREQQANRKHSHAWPWIPCFNSVRRLTWNVNLFVTIHSTLILAFASSLIVYRESIRSLLLRPSLNVINASPTCVIPVVFRWIIGRYSDNLPHGHVFFPWTTKDEYRRLIKLRSIDIDWGS